MSACGFLAERELPTDEMAGVIPLTFGRARIVSGPKEGWAWGYSEGW